MGYDMQQLKMIFTAVPAITVALTLGTGCSNTNESVAEQVMVSEPERPVTTARTKMAEASDVVVRVDGVEITQGDFAREMNTVMSRFGGQVPPEQLAGMQAELQQGVMDNLIIKQLLLNAVNKADVQIEAEEMDEMIAMYTAQLPPGMDFEDQLLQAGMTMQDFKDNLLQEMRVNKLLEEKVSDLRVPADAEVEAFYEEHKTQYFERPESVSARHILISVDADADTEERAAAQARIEDAREQLLDGADFAELAAEMSDCPSGQRGGSLGTFGRGQMVPPFEEAAFSQELDVVGDVVETDFGYHVIVVSERIAAGTSPLEEVREQIAGFLQQQSREKALRAYVETLREDADIQFAE